MQVSSVHETVRAILLRRGVSRTYADRLSRELQEHREDLMRNSIAEGLAPSVAAREADRRLGDPVLLAEAAVEKCRLTSLTGRHPVIALVLLPAFSFLPGCLLVFLVAASVTGMLSPAFQMSSLSPANRAVLEGACRACSYALPAALAAAFYIWARRRCCGSAWALTPCFVLATAASFISIRVFSAPGTGPAALVVGFAPIPDLPALLLPFCAAFLLQWRERKRAGRPETPQGHVAA